MGRSKDSRRKTSSIDASQPSIQKPNEFYVANLEIEIKAVRAKNKRLIDYTAKLKQENRTLQNECLALQKENFTLHSKYLNLKNILGAITNNLKVCLPKVSEFVAVLTGSVKLCNVASLVTDGNEVQVVHTPNSLIVNESVIKTPSISLSNINSSDGISLRRFKKESSPSSTPSTSRGIFEDSPNGSINASDEGDYVNPSTSKSLPRVLNLTATCDEDDLEDGHSEESDTETNNQELYTIAEEEEISEMLDVKPKKSGPNIEAKEIRIVLSQWHDQTILNKTAGSPPENSFCTDMSSMVAEIGDSSVEISPCNLSSDTSEKTITMDDNPSDSIAPKIVKSEPDIFDSAICNNNGLNSFTFRISDEYSSEYKTPKVEGNETSCRSGFENDISNISTRRRYHQSSNLQPLSPEPSTSTPIPIVSNLRTSARLNASLRIPDSKLIKKNSGRKNVAQVVSGRLSLEKVQDPARRVSELLDITPIVSPAEMKTSSPSESDDSEPRGSSKRSSTTRKQGGKKPIKRLKIKGKENKTLKSAIQVTRSSPRPKRAARPGVMKEPSLNKKMRRSR